MSRSEAALGDGTFSERVDFWDEMYVRRDVLGAVHQHRHHLALRWLEALRLSPGSRLLEVGCGAGHAAAALAAQRLDVTAVDLVERMLHRARAGAATAGVRERLHLARTDSLHLPFRSATFDAVLALGVLPWVASPAAAVHAMRRVLKPGAVLVVSIGNRRRLSWLLDPAMSPVAAEPRALVKRILRRVGLVPRDHSAETTTPMSRDEFRAMLAREGLRVLRLETVGFGPFTFFRRPALPNAIGLRLHGALQRRASRAGSPLGAAGEQFLALATLDVPDAVTDAGIAAGLAPAGALP